MRIAYVLQWEDGLESGVMKKVRAQIEKWGQLGAVASAFVLTARRSTLDRDLQGEEAPWLHCARYQGLSNRLAAAASLSRQIDEWQPSIFYAREMNLYPPLWFLARRLTSCIEINSDVQMERGPRISMGNAYRMVTRRLCHSAFDGFVVVTHELQRVIGSLANRRKAVVIPNGIDLANTIAEANSELREDTPRSLVFIGSKGQRWHGVDRVLQLAGVLTEWRFDLVGYDKPRSSETLDLSSNVRFHGYLPTSKYLKLLERATAGIGSLALERVGLKEACPLKVREYLARGLPAIIGYADADFPQGAPFLFRVHGEVCEWDIKGIREFLNSWQQQRVPRHAISHLDTSVKERQRLNFFQSLIGGSKFNQPFR